MPARRTSANPSTLDAEIRAAEEAAARVNAPPADLAPDTGNGEPMADGTNSGDPAPETATVATVAAEDKPVKRKYEKKVLKDITDLDILDSEDVPEDEWESHPLTDSGAERSPAQQKIDAQVKDLHTKWVAAGKPDPRHSPRKRFVVSPEDAPAIRHLIGQAGKLHDVLPKFSPVAHDQNGHEVIVYSVSAKVQRPRRDRTAAAAVQPVSTATPADTSSNDDNDDDDD